MMLESKMQILILADESVEDSAIQADSRSLATLLLIRDIQVFFFCLEQNCFDFSIIYRFYLLLIPFSDHMP